MERRTGHQALPRSSKTQGRSGPRPPPQPQPYSKLRSEESYKGGCGAAAGASSANHLITRTSTILPTTNTVSRAKPRPVETLSAKLDELFDSYVMADQRNTHLAVKWHAVAAVDAVARIELF
jgi:hypothetical protein